MSNLQKETKKYLVSTQLLYYPFYQIYSNIYSVYTRHTYQTSTYCMKQSQNWVKVQSCVDRELALFWQKFFGY